LKYRNLACKKVAVSQESCKEEKDLHALGELRYVLPEGYTEERIQAVTTREKRRRPEERRLWTGDQCAGFLAITPECLRIARSTGRGVYGAIPYYKLGRSVRYDADEVIAWVREHRVARWSAEPDQVEAEQPEEPVVQRRPRSQPRRRSRKYAPPERPAA
jgi:hypothetical protein